MDLESPRGKITIAPGVIAQIVAQTTARCYGVVGMAAARPRVGRLLPRNRSTAGISISDDGDGIALELHVVVEYGLNLAEVAATIRSQVQYEVERLTGLQVAAVGIHIRDVRQSA